MTNVDQAALPFVVRRGEERFEGGDYEDKVETIHGLVILDRDRLVFQWRADVTTESMGSGDYRDETVIGPVQEVEIPLDAVADAAIRRRWWQWRPRLVLIAKDLRAFEPLAGQDALRMPHPAELVLELRRGDRLPGLEFAADLVLASARLLERRRLDRLDAGPDG